MDILLSSALGELTSRSINFVTSKISNRSLLDVEDRLHKVLLRAEVIIDEAMGRHITNQAMIIQLGNLKYAVHRGYYMLDAYIYQANNEEEAKDQVMRHSSSLSIVNSVKRLCHLSSRGDLALKELQDMVNKLSSMIIDANELAIFLSSYPRLYCQPCSAHLHLANCMFDRQFEAQQVINFLLRQQPNSVEELDVMPIVGPGYVGKSTLVTHVCKDERVRAHFSGILFLHDADFEDDDFATLIEGSARKHKNHELNFNQDERLLLVVELVGDINDNTWKRLYSACKLYAPNGSKIIVTSRSDKIVKVGTTNALTLTYLTDEAYWHLFKTLTFGSMDQEMHPRLMHVAMKIAKTQRGSIIGANITSRLLRENLDVHFWCKMLAFLRGSFQKHASRFGENPIDLVHQNRPAPFGRMAIQSEEFVVYHQDQYFPDEEVPKITFQDIMYGSMKRHGKVEVLLWSSLIPPYYNYVVSCEIRKLKTTATKRKRSMKNGGSLC